MKKQVFKCECGYTTHFEKALEAHCRFRHHKPAAGPDGDETIVKDIEKEVRKALKAVEAEEHPAEVKKTRKPHAKKTAVKE